LVDNATIRRPVPAVYTRPRFVRPSTDTRQLPTSVSRATTSTRPRLKVVARNRRYAAVLSHLSNQPAASVQRSSSAFSGYVPKCKQNDRVPTEPQVAVTKSASSGTVRQRKTKVSFCFQSGGDELKTTATSSKSAGSLSSCAAALTPVTASASYTSVASLTTPSNVDTVPCGQVPAENCDISLLCAELFVDNNASFCDSLLESCSLQCEQPEMPYAVPGSSSFASEQDIPQPIVDFAFDDLVELDQLFSYN